MRLYLDTADRTAAESLLSTGLFAGLTTNPTILDRAGLGVGDIEDVSKWARAAGAAEIFFQAWGSTTDELVDCGHRLRDLGQDVVVKVPATRAGTAALAALAAEGIPTLLTAVYSPVQVMLAAAAGADYVAPYLGKLDENGFDGLGTVVAMQEVLASSEATTRILLASIRSVSAMVSLARAGVDCFTMGAPLAEQMFVDDQTARAVEVFDQVVASGLGQ
ncbi:transaldolase [Nocardioides scoriae]|uniref:Transaldolase n=1 Tax=Nocardioides scoriae TaxID=642780 RepID=A0A1H1PFF1_9ACTN|nr:transaldolase family protein [Nocardioides scoriae]SDS10001.1 transaldolase [Nocardioides scoriae]